MTSPRLQIDLKKIYHNTKWLVEHLGLKGIAVTGVTKVVLGSSEIARTMLSAGIESIGDSRIENIKKMCEAGIGAKYILLRTPRISKASYVVEYVDISLNTEIKVIERLSEAAQEQGKIHQIVLMVELGDLREGILPEDLSEIVCQSIGLPGIQLVGIGANLACFGGVKPNQTKMKQFSEIATSLENKFNIKLEIVSGGNSANLSWVFNSDDTLRINNLRLGESIFLGCETLNRSPIKGLYTDAITLIAEVIESKVKPSVPSGEICQDAFGSKPEFKERGMIHHNILAIGRQDVLVAGLTPVKKNVDVFGSSSDHVIVTSNKESLQIAEEVSFYLNYGALLRAMTSPYVEKVYLNESEIS